MTTVNIHQAKTNLSKLIEEVMQGHEVIIAKAGIPVALLTPIHSSKPKRQFGSMKGKIVASNDFDKSLPDALFSTDLFPKGRKK